MFVVWMLGEFTVSTYVREGLLQLVDCMLHQAIRAKGPETHPWHGEGSPMSVQVGLDIVVEYTVSTLDGLSVHSFSEIARLLWQVGNWISWALSIRLIES